MGSCLHGPHNFVQNSSQSWKGRSFFTYLAAENKRHPANGSNSSTILFDMLPPWWFPTFDASYVNIIVASSMKQIFTLEIKWRQDSPNIPSHKTQLDHPCPTYITVNDRPVQYQYFHCKTVLTKRYQPFLNSSLVSLVSGFVIATLQIFHSLENAVVDIFPNMKNIHNLFTCFDFLAAGSSSPFHSHLPTCCRFLLLW